MKSGSFFTALGVVGALASQPVHAQSVNAFDNHGRVETRAMLGVTIPLGGKKRAQETKPRLDLRFDTSRIDSDPARTRTLDPLRLQRRDIRQSVFSITMENRPRLMLNGYAVAQVGPTLYADQDAETTEEGEKEERGTGEKILRGAGWAGIGALAVVGVGAGVFLLSCGDGDCFVDD